MVILNYAENVLIAQTQTQILTTYFCTVQKSESETAPVSESGNVIKPLMPNDTSCEYIIKKWVSCSPNIFLLFLFTLPDADSNSDSIPIPNLTLYNAELFGIGIQICECKPALSEMNAVLLTRSPLKLGGSLKKSAVRSSGRCTSLNRLNVISLLAALTRKPSRIC